MKFLVLAALLVSTLASAAPQVAITVDDLPTHGDLPTGETRESVATKMIAAFKKHEVPDAYAFINAGKVEKKNESFEVLSLWQKAGYSFGNHTYLHEDINKLSPKEFAEAIDLNEAMLKRISGKRDWKYFRYPFLHEGDTLEKRNATRQHLEERGYKIAQVTVDFEDWSWNNPYGRCAAKKDAASIQWLRDSYLESAGVALDRAEVISQGLYHRSIPQIILLHIGAFDATVMDELLTSYEKKGVKFISLVDAAKDPAYAEDPHAVGKWGSEFTYQVMNARKLKLENLGLEKISANPAKKLEQICL